MLSAINAFKALTVYAASLPGSPKEVITVPDGCVVSNILIPTSVVFVSVPY